MYLGILMKQAIKEILSIADKTYYNWKKEKRPIMSFLEKYFTQEEIEEFLETGVIHRLEEKKLDENLQSLIVDDMTFHNAVFKLRMLTSPVGMKGIFIKALETFDFDDSSFTVENTKQRLIDRVQGIEKNNMFDTKSKIDTAGKWIDYYFSKLEAYIIVKRSKELLDILNTLP